MIYKLSNKMYTSGAKHRREVKREQKPRVLLVRQVNSLSYALKTLCPVETEIAQT